MNETQNPNTMENLTSQLSITQRLEGVTNQEMYDALTSNGYCISFDIKRMTPWQRVEMERQYVQYIQG